ncbi:hypothetical protein KFK09_018824 [Dendrobium nobile]|uniref:Alpha 1,4-glycosyltransferase domain-containing protein n=1 Tax=Dendrobium nobile TaxID=94219 RepID=A0A8T3AWV6_DENNO|nr:hypothetical protein KFK09_018824 [Dendrobium nobile]
MARQRQRLSFYLLFIPVTFFSVAVLLTWNSLGLLCFAGFKVSPVAASISILAIADGQLVLSPNSSKTHKNPNFLHVSRKAYTSSNSYSAPSPRPLSFSARATAFFRGHPPCAARFHMNWISKHQNFSQKELLSIESIFKFHPQACLLILSSSMDSPAGAQLLKPLTSLGFRIASITPDFGFLLNQTPAKRWFRRLQQGRVNPGEVPIAQNLSNLLRIAALYKFGGIYLDTDVIVVKEFSALRNVIGAQTADVAGNWNRLNNAVLVFDKKHPLLYEFITEFSLTFDGSKWGNNGPYLVSRVVERVKGRRRFEFSVAPPPAFYPVSWMKIEGIFKRPVDRMHEKWVEAKLENIKRESFAVHLWNRWSRDMAVEKGSLIGRIFASCCVLCNSSSSNQLSK